MKEIDYLKEKNSKTKKILEVFKKELEKLATEGSINSETIEMIRGIISFQIIGEQFQITEKKLGRMDERYYKEKILTIKRLQGLAKDYFKYFNHYWKCFQEGSTLTKYDVIFYGESCILAIGESMRLEEKLFNLTMKDCIVK